MVVYLCNIGTLGSIFSIFDNSVEWRLRTWVVRTCLYFNIIKQALAVGGFTSVYDVA